MRRHHCSPPLEPLPARPVRVSIPRGPVAVATNACVRRAKPQLKPTSKSQARYRLSSRPAVRARFFQEILFNANDSNVI